MSLTRTHHAQGAATTVPRDNITQGLSVMANVCFEMVSGFTRVPVVCGDESRAPGVEQKV
jgi:hypothetical protein